MRIGLPGGGAPSTGSSSRRSGPRPRASPASGTRARSPATRWSRSRWRPGDVDDRARHRVLQTYTCHPVLLSRTVRPPWPSAIGAPGLHARHRPVARPRSRACSGCPTTRRAAHRRVRPVLTALLRGEPVRFAGGRVPREAGVRRRSSPQPVPVLVAALAPRLLRVAGEYTAARSSGWATRWRSKRTSRRGLARLRPMPVDPRPGSSPGSRRGARRRGRGASNGSRVVRDVRHAAQLPAHPRPRRRRPDPRTPRSSATRPRSPRRSKRCSRPARPTCGPRRSRSATTSRIESPQHAAFAELSAPLRA